MGGACLVAWTEAEMAWPGTHRRRYGAASSSCPLQTGGGGGSPQPHVWDSVRRTTQPGSVCPALPVAPRAIYPLNFPALLPLKHFEIILKFLRIKSQKILNLKFKLKNLN